MTSDPVELIRRDFNASRAGDPMDSADVGTLLAEIERLRKIESATRELRDAINEHTFGNGPWVANVPEPVAARHRALFALLDQKEQSTRDWLAEIGDVPVVIWFCPHRQERGCKFVEWDDDGETMTPRCRDCGEVGPSRPKRSKKEQSTDE